MSVLVPVLEDILGWRDPQRVRGWFEERGLLIHGWEKLRTDVLAIRGSLSAMA